MSPVPVARDDDDLIAAVTAIKRQPGRDIGVAGGVRTAQRFARLGLIDEYVLQVHPVALGVGQPLFTDRTEVELASVKAYASGVMRVRYHPRRHPPPATRQQAADTASSALAPAVRCGRSGRKASRQNAVLASQPSTTALSP